MKKAHTLLAALMILSLSAKPQAGTTRDLPPFTRVDVSKIDRVLISQDSVQRVSVESDNNDDVHLSVNNGTLQVRGKGDADVYLSMPSVEALTVSGSGEIIGQTPIRSESLKLSIGGDGKMELEVHTTNLEADISGLGKMTLSGTSKQADLNISGSGKISAYELKTENCNATISGLGKCTIDVTDHLNCDISGSGSVQYKNAPLKLTKNVTGIGKVGLSDSASSSQDTTRINLGSTEVIIIDPGKVKTQRKTRTRPVWAGFEMGLNNYVNADGKFEMPAGYEFLDLRTEKSVSVGLNLVQKNIQLGNSNVWFFTGLGFTWNNYRFRSNVTLQPTTPISAVVDTSGSVNYIKSKLTSWYLTAPLMFECFTSKNPKKAFHFGAGALLGLNLLTHTKQKYEIDGDTHKRKIFNDFGTPPFRAGVRVAMGVSKINLFADYYFTPFFSSGQGPKLYAVNAGITLVGF
jgi:hypothetical protein